MRITAPYPAYYCPPGINLPDHCGWRGLIGPAQILAHSPDGQVGMYWGPNYDPSTLNRWTKTSAGWWILMDAVRPEHFARMRTMAGLGVDGATEGQKWLIPQLLRWDPTSILVCAADEIYKDGSWQPPAHLQGILETLRAMALAEIQPTRAVSDPEALALGVEILALNYHISLVELDLAGWMTSGFLSRILRTAMGEQALLASLRTMQAEAAG